MLIGEFTHTIDSKNRTSLPAKFKGQMGDSVVVSKGVGKFLSVYTKESWNKLAEKLNSLSITNIKQMEFKRKMFSGASEVQIDKQGRILIPATLCEYANIEGSTKVVWAGVGENAEIWAESVWEKHMLETQSTEELAEELEGII